MTRNRTIALLVGIAVFAASGYVAYALTDDSPDPVESTSRRLPETGTPIPVFAPVPVVADAWEEGSARAAQVAAEREAASQIGLVLEATDVFDAPVRSGSATSGSSAPAGAATSSTVSGTGSGSGTSTTTSSAETAPTLETITEEDAEPAPLSASPPAGEAEPSSTALDACAGDDAPESCPDGVPGVVLGLRDLPPLEAFLFFQPRVPGTSLNPWDPECLRVPPAARAAPFGLSVNRPARVDLTYYPSRPGRGPDLTRPTTVELATSPEQDARWQSWADDPSAGFDDPRFWLYLCFQIDGLAPGTYLMTGVVTDKNDPAVETTLRDVPFFMPDEFGEVPVPTRRPTVVLPAGLDRAYVWTTRESPQQLFVQAVPRTSATTGTCDTGGDDSVLHLRDGRVHGVVELDSEIPESTRLVDDYPYLHLHDRSMVYRLDLEEGTDYLVCLYWATAGPSFDPFQVVDAEQVPVTTPDALRPRVNLEGLANLFGEVSSVGVWVDLVGRDCRAQVLDFAEGRAGPFLLCALDTGLSDLQARGIPITFLLTDPFGDQYRSTVIIRAGRLGCSSAPCPERPDEVALVPLPSIPTVRRLCGSGFGGGCSEEVPTRSAGDAIISIEYDREPAGASREWVIGEPAAFTDSLYEPGDTTLLDVEWEWRASPSAPAGLDLDVRVTADRPAEVTVSLTGPDGTEPCTTGAADLDGSSPTASSHAFSLQNLCHGTAYELIVGGVDGGGRPVVIHRPAAAPSDTVSLDSPLFSADLTGLVTVTVPDLRGTTYFVDGGQLVVHAEELPPRHVAWTSGNWRATEPRACTWGPLSSDATVFQPGPTLTLEAAGRAGLPQEGLVVTAHVEVWEVEFEPRLRGGVEVCGPGPLVGIYDLAANVGLEDLQDGIVLSSDDGVVTVELRAD